MTSQTQTSVVKARHSLHLSQRQKFSLFHKEGNVAKYRNFLLH